VTTQNNVEAEMTQACRFRFRPWRTTRITVTFKDAALTLKVTPQITAREHRHHANFAGELLA
jgi:hypothetical protein